MIEKVIANLDSLKAGSDFIPVFGGSKEFWAWTFYILAELLNMYVWRSLFAFRFLFWNV